MSTRNLSGAESPSCSSSVRLRTAPTSSSVLTLLLSCQRQSFHFSSGTSCHSGARGLPVRPEGLGRVARVDPLGIGGRDDGGLVGGGNLDLPGVHAIRSPQA